MDSSPREGSAALSSGSCSGRDSAVSGFSWVSGNAGGNVSRASELVPAKDTSFTVWVSGADCSVSRSSLVRGSVERDRPAVPVDADVSLSIDSYYYYRAPCGMLSHSSKHTCTGLSIGQQVPHRG